MPEETAQKYRIRIAEPDLMIVVPMLAVLFFVKMDIPVIYGILLQESLLCFPLQIHVDRRAGRHDPRESTRYVRTLASDKEGDAET